ncbi:MAG: hypothetical protein KDB65_00510 [Calditrichaeota bacterium]|nr:hypothetical protein [Calditrichota bacterium]
MRQTFRLILFFVVSAFLWTGVVYAQTYDTLRVMTYNLLNYPGTTSSSRNPEFQKVLHATDPDILIVQEMQSSSGVSEFLSQVLNNGQPGTYTNAPFSNGPDTDNALFYKPSVVSFLSQTVLSTQLRDINGYLLRPAGVFADSLDIRIYSAHLKASQGFEADREAEATIVRNHLNGLGPGYYIFGGDFNLYTSSEGAFQVLTESQADNDGRLYDVLNEPGSWHNSASFADIHTQSPRVTDLGDGGSTGGLDDRFDFLLPTYLFQGLPGWQVIPSSYTEYGNDGLHFGQAINSGTNFAVPDSIADALHAATDHLPVFMEIVRQVAPSPSVAVLSPNGGESFGQGDTMSVTWNTTSYSGTVSISLSRNGAVGTYETLASGTANDGQFSWLVTGDPTTQARIKVVLDSAPTFSDISDNDFTVFERDISIFTPVANDSHYVGFNMDIQWTALGVSGNVRVELNRLPSSPGWEVLTTSTPNTGFFGWTVTGPVTDSARVRVLSLSAPSIGDTSAMFKIKSLTSNQPPEILHNPICDPLPGNVAFFCQVLDDGAFFAPYLIWTTNDFATKDSLQLSSVTAGYSGTIPLSEGFIRYFLKDTDAGNLTARTDTFDVVVAAQCPSEIAYDDGSVESYQWSADQGMTWAVLFTPPITPFVLCETEYAVSVRKPDSAHGLMNVYVLDSNGPSGLPGDTLGAFTSGTVPNSLNGAAGSSPGTGRTVFQKNGEPAIAVFGDFYVGVSQTSTAFGLDEDGAATARSYLWDACDMLWVPENGVHPNSRPGQRVIKVRGFGLIPPQVVIAPSGNDAVLHWSDTGAPSYTIYRSALVDGPFDTSVGITSDTTWTDSGVLTSLGEAFYVVRATLP